jgi:hypothetical protein
MAEGNSGGAELVELIGYSLAMLGGCFAAGLLPLSMSLSERNIQVCRASHSSRSGCMSSSS